MMSKYESIVTVSIHLEETTWRRIKYDGSGKTHNHAFVKDSSCRRFADVEMTRDDLHPTVTSGLKDFKVLKTTKSSFYGFSCDEYCNLEPIFDRLLSTSIDSSWTYIPNQKINFDQTFEKVKQLILFGWSGDLDDGVQSTSTQGTSYLIEKLILDNVKHVKSIKMTLPNLHYNAFNFDKFKSLGVDNEEETVFIPIEKPAGLVHAELER